MKETFLEERDLKFWQSIKGRKTHYIFKQDNIFYVLTTQDKGSRGNFLCIDQEEVEKVKQQLALKVADEEFRCDEVYQKITGLRVPLPAKSTKTKDEDPQRYYVDRLMRICYILCVQGFLKINQVSRSIYFQKQSKLIQIAVQVSDLSAAGQLTVDFSTIQLLKDAVRINKRDDGWSDLSRDVSSYLMHRSIIPKAYGYKNFKALFKGINIFDLKKAEDSHTFVREK